MVHVFSGKTPPKTTVNALILLQSSLALVELDKDDGVGDIDEEVDGDSQDDEGQDEVYWGRVTENALNVAGKPCHNPVYIQFHIYF